jgi:hypothetical protein
LSTPDDFWVEGDPLESRGGLGSVVTVDHVADAALLSQRVGILTILIPVLTGTSTVAAQIMEGLLKTQ